MEDTLYALMVKILSVPHGKICKHYVAEELLSLIEGLPEYNKDKFNAVLDSLCGLYTPSDQHTIDTIQGKE